MIFIKLENGNVKVTTDGGDSVLLIQDTGIQLSVVGAAADSIQIRQFGYPIYSVAAADVSATQIEPAAAVAFADTAYDLIDLLGEGFFLLKFDIDFFQSAAEGDFPYYETGRKNGFYENVNTTEQLVADIGGNPYQPIAAATIEVISTSANDTAAGTGARKVTVEGLDQNWNVVQEVITLNGLAASAASTTTFIRVNRTFVSEMGTYAAANAGTLTVRVSGAGANWLTIPAGQGQTKHCFYTVPAGKTLYLYDLHIEPENSKSIAFNLWNLRNANDVAVPFTGAKRISNRYPFTQTSMDYDYKNAPLIFNAYTDIWITAQTSTGTASASAEFTFVLKDN